MGTLGYNQCRSLLICAKAGTEGERLSFWPRKAEIISPSVAENVVEKFIPDLWGRMLHGDEVGSKIFEDYRRKLMATPPARSFLCGPGCGRCAEDFKLDTNVTLGACKTIRLGSDIARAVIDGDSMTLFHTISPSQHLFDFIYKDYKGKVHAFKP